MGLQNRTNRLPVWLLLGWSCYLVSIIAYAQDSTLIEFNLKDQFDREYTHESWKDSVIVLIGSDKDGSAYNQIWGEAIHDTLEGIEGNRAIKFVGLSDLRGVPFFLKGYVRGKFPTDRNSWVLMDWKGRFPKTYDFQSKSCNILIFDQNRMLIYRTAVREFSQGELTIIIDKLVQE